MKFISKDKVTFEKSSGVIHITEAESASNQKNSERNAQFRWAKSNPHYFPFDIHYPQRINYFNPICLYQSEDFTTANLVVFGSLDTTLLDDSSQFKFKVDLEGNKECRRKAVKVGEEEYIIRHELKSNVTTTISNPEIGMYLFKYTTIANNTRQFDLPFNVKVFKSGYDILVNNAQKFVSSEKISNRVCHTYNAKFNRQAEDGANVPISYKEIWSNIVSIMPNANRLNIIFIDTPTMFKYLEEKKSSITENDPQFKQNINDWINTSEVLAETGANIQWETDLKYVTSQAPVAGTDNSIRGVEDTNEFVFSSDISVSQGKSHTSAIMNVTAWLGDRCPCHGTMGNTVYEWRWADQGYRISEFRYGFALLLHNLDSVSTDQEFFHIEDLDCPDPTSGLAEIYHTIISIFSRFVKNSKDIRRVNKGWKVVSRFIEDELDNGFDDVATEILIPFMNYYYKDNEVDNDTKRSLSYINRFNYLEEAKEFRHHFGMPLRRNNDCISFKGYTEMAAKIRWDKNLNARKKYYNLRTTKYNKSKAIRTETNIITDIVDKYEGNVYNSTSATRDGYESLSKLHQKIAASGKRFYSENDIDDILFCKWADSLYPVNTDHIISDMNRTLLRDMVGNDLPEEDKELDNAFNGITGGVAFSKLIKEIDNDKTNAIFDALALLCMVFMHTCTIYTEIMSLDAESAQNLTVHIQNFEKFMEEYTLELRNEIKNNLAYNILVNMYRACTATIIYHESLIVEQIDDDPKPDIIISEDPKNTYENNKQEALENASDESIKEQEHEHEDKISWVQRMTDFSFSAFTYKFLKWVTLTGLSTMVDVVKMIINIACKGVSFAAKVIGKVWNYLATPKASEKIRMVTRMNPDGKATVLWSNEEGDTHGSLLCSRQMPMKEFIERCRSNIDPTLVPNANFIDMLYYKGTVYYGLAGFLLEFNHLHDDSTEGIIECNLYAGSQRSGNSNFNISLKAHEIEKTISEQIQYLDAIMPILKDIVTTNGLRVTLPPSTSFHDASYSDYTMTDSVDAVGWIDDNSNDDGIFDTRSNDKRQTNWAVAAEVDNLLISKYANRSLSNSSELATEDDLDLVSTSPLDRRLRNNYNKLLHKQVPNIYIQRGNYSNARIWGTIIMAGIAFASGAAKLLTFGIRKSAENHAMRNLIAGFKDQWYTYMDQAKILVDVALSGKLVFETKSRMKERMNDQDIFLKSFGHVRSTFFRYNEGFLYTARKLKCAYVAENPFRLTATDVTKVALAALETAAGVGLAVSSGRQWMKKKDLMYGGMRAIRFKKKAVDVQGNVLGDISAGGKPLFDSEDKYTNWMMADRETGAEFIKEKYDYKWIMTPDQKKEYMQNPKFATVYSTQRKLQWNHKESDGYAENVAWRVLDNGDKNAYNLVAGLGKASMNVAKGAFDAVSSVARRFINGSKVDNINAVLDEGLLEVQEAVDKSKEYLEDLLVGDGVDTDGDGIPDEQPDGSGDKKPGGILGVLLDTITNKVQANSRPDGDSNKFN